MKKVSLLIVGIFSANLLALDINGAVEQGFEKSHTLKQSQLNQKLSQTYVEKANSGYRPTLNVNYFISKSDENNPDTSYDLSYASISLGYNLFNGFKNKYAIEGAKESAKSATFQKDALKADVKLQIQLSYIDFLEKRKTLSTKEEAVKLVAKSLQDTQAYFEQGLVAKNALLETQVSLSRAKQDFLVAKSELLISRDSLNRLLGGTLKNEEEIKDIYFEITSVESVENLIKNGLQNRSEIKSLKANIKEAGLTYNSSKSDLYPKVDLAFSHTKYGEDGNLNGRTYSYDDQTVASLNFSYNLYNGGANEADRTAYMYKTQIAQEQLKALELDTILQIKKAKESYELALENEKVAKDAREFAQENYSIMENRYKSQLEKTTDFLKSRLDLSEAKISYIKSLYGIYAQYVTLLRVIEK